MVARLLWFLCFASLQVQSLSDPVAITFEILPEDDGSAPTTSEVYDQFVSKVATRDGEITESDYLKGLNSKVENVH